MAMYVYVFNTENPLLPPTRKLKKRKVRNFLPLVNTIVSTSSGCILDSEDVSDFT